MERAQRSGASSIAVLTRRNEEAARLHRYLSIKGVKPRQVGAGRDFEEARVDIEHLLETTDPAEVAGHALDRVQGLIPTLPVATVDQVRRRLRPDGVEFKQSGSVARAVLSALQVIYDRGPGAYFQAVTSALDASMSAGHHLARVDTVVPFRETVTVLDREEADAARAVEVFSERVSAAAHRAPRIGPGVFVMTAHQSKGKEFDGVVLAYGSTREYPEGDVEAIRLFYVAITRGRTDWTIIVPDTNPSPLIEKLIG